ncbi:MerR family transcriptional regulator [Kibdelosporangium aridum]|uniref:DNA-binding transcriptional regulator, MerR family n=1 Tax=Kibdelosporangium aridum TaxID=2030 RepID=A0A1Y5Y341_KIBAR|nr:MerR family transcriptional regulator [Kibdelosporangium aridum]SMD24878.1 DNA-binding transcriptional regulator, MerR family [Kibdelosporangium aridum]
MRHGVTIGQAATFIGVTVKTVRHYHKLGLVEEPERDSSGYRRYGSAELLRLVQVRTLATAGVPLAEIGPLLNADAEQFAATLAAAQRRLTDQIADLINRRDTLHRLADGDRALLPDRACAILDRMSALGFRPDYVAAQREAMVLTRAMMPQGFEGFLAQLEHRLDDPGYVDLTKRASEAETWEPDDPRIEELATAMADHYLANPTLLGNPNRLHAWTNNSTQYRLINNHREDQAPISARLTALTETKLRSAGVPIPRQ